MNARTAAIGAVLGVLGLAAAVGIGLAANSISDDSVGLSAQPLSAGNTLAPKAPQKAKDHTPGRTERGERTDTAPPASSPQAADSPAAPQDDHGNAGESSTDGSGSSGSNSGSSGSSGSGSSGTGSGDSGGSDDNSGHGSGSDD